MEESKSCSKCKIVKLLSAFPKDHSRKDGTRSNCRDCEKKRKQEHYRKNQDNYRDRHREYRKQNREKINESNRKNWKKVGPDINKKRLEDKKRSRKLVFEYKLTHPCIDCGESDPVVLDFDHRDPSLKKEGVARMLSSGYSWELIQHEIEKCDIRCANCHRRKTSKERSFKFTPTS